MKRSGGRDYTVQRVNIVEHLETVKIRKHNQKRSYREEVLILLIHEKYSILLVKSTIIEFSREASMTILLISGFCAVLVLVLIGSLKLQVWNSGAHMTNTNGLDAAEKFHLIARWGA